MEQKNCGVDQVRKNIVEIRDVAVEMKALLEKSSDLLLTAEQLCGSASVSGWLIALREKKKDAQVYADAMKSYADACEQMLQQVQQVDDDCAARFR